MDRATKSALEAYPAYESATKRLGFVDGYHKAEKDLALTWQDIKRIVQIADDLLPGIDTMALLSEFQTEEAYYKEILKRFNETKK